MPGDHGAHGRFDSEATGTSVQQWLDLNRAPLAIGALAAAVLALALRKR